MGARLTDTQLDELTCQMGLPANVTDLTRRWVNHMIASGWLSRDMFAQIIAPERWDGPAGVLLLSEIMVEYGNPFDR